MGDPAIADTGRRTPEVAPQGGPEEVPQPPAWLVGPLGVTAGTTAEPGRAPSRRGGRGLLVEVGALRGSYPESVLERFAGTLRGGSGAVPGSADGQRGGGRPRRLASIVRMAVTMALLAAGSPPPPLWRYYGVGSVGRPGRAVGAESNRLRGALCTRRPYRKERAGGPLGISLVVYG